MDHILVFSEPHPTGGVATVRVTIDQAIKYQKEALRKRYPDKEYLNDYEAVMDFKIIHGAWFE